MQNHSSYTESFDNFHPDIKVEGTDSAALNNYLSLMKLSDEALQELITYFEGQDEETIIVFFGDHQPTNSVVEPVWKLNGKRNSTLTEEEVSRRYKVPFIIWANYDIKEKTIDKMSANYLSAYVMNEAGLETSPYQKFLLKLRKKLPVLTAMGCFDKKGKYYESALESPYSDMVKEYQILQYNNLIDTKHTVNSFFYLSDEQKK